MICTKCGKTGSKVIDKRNNTENNTIRRRRECLYCGNRYTTYEKIENFGMLVRKKSGRIEEYDREKLKRSIVKGLRKRNIADDRIEKFIDRVEIRIDKLKKSVIDS